MQRVFITSRQLAKLKTKAQRSGKWFTALKRIDRALIDLTIRLASTIRNTRLVKSVLAIASKIGTAVTSLLVRDREEVSFVLARKLAAIAIKLGNSLARNWASDFSFARFLAVMHFNEGGRARG